MTKNRPLAPVQDRRWVLAVDFGTTNTVAAVAEVGTVPRLLDQPMPSAVFRSAASAGGPERWVVGQAALSSARNDMTRFELAPKRRVAEGSVLLGGRSYPTAEVIGAVLHRLFVEAARQHDETAPAALVLTHPARWGRDRLDVLLAAAAAAAAGLPGWPRPGLLPEPVAAAHQMARTARGLPPVCRVAVLDLGGGTCDVAVLDRSHDTFTVAGSPLGEDPLGGDDFDVALVDYALADVNNPELTFRLTSPQEADDRVRAHDLLLSARAAKELLTDEPTATIVIPAVPGLLPAGRSVPVSQRTLNQLIVGDPKRPGLRRAAELAAEALANAPQPGPPFGAVFLVGGSSRIPLLGQLVTETTHHRPSGHGRPETAVAEGAAAYALAEITTPRKDTPPPPPPPPPGRPWYRKPAVLVTTLVLVGALLAALIGAFGGGGDTYVTCSNGSTAPNYSECPTTTPGGGTKSTYTCPDGTEVTDASECASEPPEEPANWTCWDDTEVVDATDCPAIEGLEGLQWIYESDPPFDNCSEVTDLEDGQEENYLCDVPGSDAATVSLSRWSSTAKAKKYFDSYMDERTPSYLTRDKSTTLTSWIGSNKNGKYYVHASLYDHHPFSVEAYAKTPFKTDVTRFWPTLGFNTSKTLSRRAVAK